MAQAPATPKAARLLRLWRARLPGAQALRRDPALAPSERAALELRAARAGVPPKRAEAVHFLIPLVGPHHVSDWDAVETRLAQTLDSLIAQGDARWTATICCQVRPGLPDDPRIRHLPFDDPTPGNDKWRKLAALCTDLGDRAGAPGYAMTFDADDLLHPDAVSEMLTRQEPGGYLAETGYVLDHGTGQIALAGPPTLAKPLRKPFWKLCGSCAALLHDPALPASTAFLREMTQHEHRMFPYLAALAGQPLTPFGRPVALYVLNHGENFGARRGRIGFKARFVKRFALASEAEIAQVRAGFNLTGRP